MELQDNLRAGFTASCTDKQWWWQHRHRHHLVASSRSTEVDCGTCSEWTRCCGTLDLLPCALQQVQIVLGNYTEMRLSSHFEVALLLSSMKTYLSFCAFTRSSRWLLIGSEDAISAMPKWTLAASLKVFELARVLFDQDLYFRGPRLNQALHRFTLALQKFSLVP